VCEQLVTDITNEIDTKDETVDSLENKWESEHTLNIDTLTSVRLDMSKLRRFLLPQLEAFQKLSLVILAQFSTEKEDAACAARWREICNSTHRDLEVITEMKERVTILREGLEQRMNRAMNRIMYLLSVVAAFFLPLTFIASLLGMNVTGIPGNEHPWAFFWVCSIMLIVSLFQLLLFKRWKWFG
jgi:zinc transporter